MASPVLRSRLISLSMPLLVAGALVASFGPPRLPIAFAQGAGKPWPPPVAAVDPAAAPKSPADSMATFTLPPGYRVELVAAEPMIQDPILSEFDADGRLWVIEMPGFMPELNPSDARERQPDGRIVVLEDTNDDGTMDARRVFLDGLVLPRAMKVLSDGVLVAEPPNLWFVKFDAQGNAGEKTLVTTGYGTLNAGIEHNENSLWWGFDNWLHTSEGTTLVRRRHGQFEVQRTLSRGQWGATHDDAGRIYRNTNESALHVDLVPTLYYARNPNLVRTRGSYESLAGPDRELNRVWPAHATPGVNRGYVLNVLAPNGTLANFTSVSSPVVFRGDRLPADVYGNVFVVEPAGNLVSRIVLDESGPELTARKAYEGAEFLVSTDERFRPVYLSPGPDGTLYILDMYRGIIQHRDYVTEYLRDQILARDLTMPVSRGRLYRVVHDTLPRGPKPHLSAASSAELVRHLSHANGWWRDTAHRMLVERADASTVPALRALATQTTDARAQLHALWILDGMDAVDEAIVRQALDAPSRDIRRAAVRLAERWMSDAAHPLVAAVRAHADDADVSVRRQVAASLGTLPEGARPEALAAVLGALGNDPVAVDAALSGLRGAEDATLALMLASPARTPAREAAITMLTATVVRSADDTAIHHVFAQIDNDARAEWQRVALLSGVEVAWLNARAPGTPAPRAAGPAQGQPQPCPTCPGARTGPGGASAFMRPQGGGRQGGPAPIRVNREPEGLASVVNEGGALGERAARVLARIEWPGKPGATTVTPLTPDEQRRFDAGREVFTNACAACHQADGRGRDRVAPTLVGSDLVLAPAGIAARILINGKEGPTGLMPPLGQGLSDDQLAAVLTYVRRQWGNTGTAVDPAAVRAVRAETAGRARPWTQDEITALAAGTR